MYSQLSMYRQLVDEITEKEISPCPAKYQPYAAAHYTVFGQTQIHHCA